jgi:hypothetical protein
MLTHPAHGLLASLLCVLTVSSLHAETLTYKDLVHRMVDMEHLATLPPDGEVGGLASSYDRASQYDAAKDQYVHWDANDDGHGFIREEGDQQVLAEIKGPGCIWRLWSAAPCPGHVKIFLDGSSTPAVDMHFEDYFGSKGPFGQWKNLVYYHAGEPGPHVSYNPGSNDYVPIPFLKSCKITGDKGDGVPEHNLKWGQYFQCTYTTFAPGTVVPDFKMPISDEDAAALTEVDHAFDNCGADPAAQPGQKVDTKSVTVEPGKTSAAFEASGEEAITLLKIKTALPEYAAPQRDLLRQLTIRITWDGEKTPAIWSPLGDFFGYLGGAGPFCTLPVGQLDDGTFYSHWYMPFAKSAKIELGNDSPSPVTFAIETTTAPLDKPITGLARFHAKWHRDAFNPERKDRFPDWTLVTTQGKGRFVGTTLHVWNPNGGWWGEGDEKFFIDGEKFPSYFGTGSEDYFGYAWGCASRFIHAFHAQPFNESNNGHVDDIRWMISDNVPFQKSFEGILEKYPPSTTPADKPFDPMSLEAAMDCWYLSADGTDSYGEVPVDQRLGYWKRNASYNEPDAIEGETMEQDGWALDQPSADAMWGIWPGGIKGTKAGVWSGDMQFGWHPRNLDQKLKLKFPVAKAGKYKVLVRLTKSAGGGIFQLGVDGKNLGSPVDLYDKDFVALDPLELGDLDLSAGDHVLNITPTGKNPAVGGDQPTGGFGLDYLKLR